MAFDSKKTRLLACDVYAGSAQKQVQKIVFFPDVAGSLDGDYFLFYTETGAKHYVWYAKDSSTVDPAPAGGWTGHKVTFNIGDSATAIATATATVLAALSTIMTSAVATGGTLIFTLLNTGYAQPARDSDNPLHPTGFGFSVVTLGDTEFLIGLIDGDIETSGFGADELDVKSHQTGSTILGKIVTGMKSPELSFTMMETDRANIKRAFQWAGQYSQTPEGADGVESFGYGEGIVGSSKPRKRFRLHPRANGTDKSEDLVFWQCTSDLDKISFSAEKISTIPVKITAYPDSTKPTRYNIMYVGDATNFV